jgi:ABC-type maltose transport system permease subunit
MSRSGDFKQQKQEKMETETKLIIYCVSITLILFGLTRVSYLFSSTGLRYKYWVKENLIGCFYLLAKYATIALIIIIYFIRATEWWLKNR